MRYFKFVSYILTIILVSMFITVVSSSENDVSEKKDKIEAEVNPKNKKYENGVENVMNGNIFEVDIKTQRTIP